VTRDKPVHRVPGAKPPTSEEVCRAYCEALRAIGSGLRRPQTGLEILRRLCERVRELGEMSVQAQQIRKPGRREPTAVRPVNSLIKQETP